MVLSIGNEFERKFLELSYGRQQPVSRSNRPTAKPGFFKEGGK
jgi:hypothetical protein